MPGAYPETINAVLTFSVMVSCLSRGYAENGDSSRHEEASEKHYKLALVFTFRCRVASILNN